MCTNYLEGGRGIHFGGRPLLRQISTKGVRRYAESRAMNADDLRASARNEAPPLGLDVCLHALWLDARGDWNAAHELIDDVDGAAAAWVHAYLHRKEGDASNAAYWYAHAGRPVFTGELADEWHAIAEELLRR
jgi:hypothetical protein